MKRIVLIGIIYLGFSNIYAQKKSKDTTLFTYGNHQVTLSEFSRGFTKNEKPGTKHTAAEVDEYLELYRKFKLKVQDAYDQGLDTTPAFLDELASYRSQIAKPYLTDKVVNEQLVKEAYDRLNYDVRASHILVLARYDSSPADTLKAYKQIQDLRNQIVEGKLTFDNAAETFSEDPSARENHGDLGYFTAFQLVYEFENVAFNTPVGQVSPIFRTQFGYHILKVTNKRKASGNIVVRQIYLQTNPNANNEELAEVKTRIDEVYKKLQNGEKFESMVNQYSEDAQTAMNNGELPPFSMTTSNLDEKFKQMAFSLTKDGDYTAPFQTQYGFHILKRISLQTIPPLDEMRPTILNKISRDSRQYKNTVAIYNRIQKYYKTKFNPKAYQAYRSLIDSSLLNGTYQFKSNGKISEKKFNKLAKTPLFTLTTHKKAYTVKDFGKYLETLQEPMQTTALTSTVDKLYDNYKMSSITNYYEDDLANINDTFAALYKEYKEGILLFSLTDKEVWSKSVEDTTGLKAFYEKNKSKYQFTDRYDATIFRCSNKAVADQVRKDLDAGMIIDSIVKKANKINPLSLQTPISGKYEKGDNPYADMLFATNTNNTNKYIIFEDIKVPGAFVLIQIHTYLPAANKSLNEARGSVISDYQNYLEKQWIEKLSAKNPFHLDNNIYTIFKNRVIK